MNLMACSIQGAALIACALLMRRTRLPRQGAEALYALACLRLLIPLPLTTPWGLFSISEGSARMVEAAGGGIQAAAPKAGTGGWLFALWLAGALAAAGLFLFSWLRARRTLAASLPLNRRDLEKLMDPGLRIALRYSDQITTPCAWGLVRPRIVLPAGLAGESAGALYPVLLHEQAHIRRKDTLRKLALGLCLCVHWFNPLAWAMWCFAARDMEIMCDSRAVGAMPQKERAAYALSLLTLEELRFSLAGPPCFSRRAAKERLRDVMRGNRASRAGSVLCAGLVLACALALGTSAPAVPPAALEEAAPRQSGAVGVTAQSPAAVRAFLVSDLAAGEEADGFKAEVSVSIAPYEIAGWQVIGEPLQSATYQEVWTDAVIWDQGLE